MTDRDDVIGNRCDMCELLSCGFVVGVEQQLQAAMWVDRRQRFGDAGDPQSHALRSHTPDISSCRSV